MESFASQEIKCVVDKEGNEICNDCKAERPRWVSINNSVLICSACARVHQKFDDENISIVKSIEVDLFSKEEIELLMLGGNKRFTEIINEYITNDVENYNELKYHLVIADYYRQLLKLEIKKDKNFIYLKEFGEYLLKKPLIEEGVELVDINESPITKTLSSVVNKINVGLEAIGQVIANKAHQMGIDAKIKEVSTFLSNKINDIGNNNPITEQTPISNEIPSKEEINKTVENLKTEVKTKITKEELPQLIQETVNKYKIIKQKREEKK